MVVLFFELGFSGEGAGGGVMQFVNIHHDKWNSLFSSQSEARYYTQVIIQEI